MTTLVAGAGENGNRHDVDVVLLKSVYLQQPDVVREIGKAPVRVFVFSRRTRTRAICARSM
ncbi:hypothetical protein ACOJBM_22720 [Rhizobium beringeri]